MNFSDGRAHYVQENFHHLLKNIILKVTEKIQDNLQIYLICHHVQFYNNS